MSVSIAGLQALMEFTKSMFELLTNVTILR